MFYTIRLQRKVATYKKTRFVVHTYSGFARLYNPCFFLPIIAYF